MGLMEVLRRPTVCIQNTKTTARGSTVFEWFNFPLVDYFSSKTLLNISNGKIEMRDILLEHTHCNNLILARLNFQTCNQEEIFLNLMCVKYDPYRNIMYWEDDQDE